jgi:hypothetical protein
MNISSINYSVNVYRSETCFEDVLQRRIQTHFIMPSTFFCKPCVFRQKQKLLPCAYAYQIVWFFELHEYLMRPEWISRIRFEACMNFMNTFRGLNELHEYISRPEWTYEYLSRPEWTSRITSESWINFTNTFRGLNELHEYLPRLNELHEYLPRPESTSRILSEAWMNVTNTFPCPVTRID